MYFVLEDREESGSAQLYYHAYQEFERKRIVFTSGNGNLCSSTEDLLKSTEEEEIYVLIDMVPNNDDIRRIYRNLCKLSRKYDNRAYIMPITCAEYYILKSLVNLGVIEPTEDVNTAVEKQPYYASALRERDGRVCKTFERYCKVVLETLRLECLYQPNAEKCEMYGAYYNRDCRCVSCVCGLKEDAPLQSKAIDFVKKYPCFPTPSDNWMGIRMIDDPKGKQRVLVDEFNQLCDKFAKVDSSRRYNHIGYL